MHLIINNILILILFLFTVLLCINTLYSSLVGGDKAAEREGQAQIKKKEEISGQRFSYIIPLKLEDENGVNTVSLGSPSWRMGQSQADV